MSGRGKDLEKYCEQLLTATGGFWHRNEPPMRGRIRIRSGVPDYVVILDGRPHYVECKAEAKQVMRLGNLTPPVSGAGEGQGVYSGQAEVMDRIERAGGRCFILARLTHRDGEVTEMIPWRVWRGWLAAGLRSATPEMLEAAGDAAWQEGRLPGDRP